MMQFKRRSTLVAAIVLLSGCSGGGSDTPSESPIFDTLPLEARMATKMTDTAGEMWLCGVNESVVAAYLFIPAGQIEGLNPEHLLGMEIDHTKPSMADQTQFLWSVTDEGSLMMDLLSDVEPVIWSSVTFLDDNQIQVDSSTRGPLACYRGVGDLPRVVS